jgi:hypothetical protein
MSDWNPLLVDVLAKRLCATAGLPAAVARTPIRVWELSGVERLHLASGAAVILKYARPPFTDERHALSQAALRVPVPAVIAATTHRGVAAMLLVDLGESSRQAELRDAAMAAARLHAGGRGAGFADLDEFALRSMPAQMLDTLDLRQNAGPDADAVRAPLIRLDKVAGERAVGAWRQPYGMCHGELHPTAIHIDESGWWLLDLATAYNGPGLLDLASWFGNRAYPDAIAMRSLISLYVEAGGHPDAHADRGGMPAPIWAMAWHRVCAADWQLRHAPDPEARSLVAARQLRIAAALMRA